MKPAVFVSAFILYAASALGQIRGVPASVTSITPNNPTPGIGASVTSLGPHGYVSKGTAGGGWTGYRSQFGNAPYVPPTTFTCSYGFCAPTTVGNYGHRHRPRHGGYGYGYSGYAYAPYYPVYTTDYGTGTYAEPEAYEPPEPEPPAPTIFERRPTTRPYASEVAPAAQPQAAAQPQQPIHSELGVGGEETTTLVFRDGRQMDIHNYAIVSGSIFNFDGTGPFKTPLSELDIPATIKLNENRGVIFKVPAKS